MLPTLLLLLAAPAIILPPPQAPAQAPTQAPNVDQLIARHLEARGGLANLRAVRTRKTTGVMTGLAPFDIPFTIEQKRPGFFRRELAIQGAAQILVFDGKDGWKVDPFATGTAKPQPLTLEDVKDLMEDADMDGCLVDWAAKGDKVAYAGQEDLDSGPAYKLKVAFADGRVSVIFLDARSYQEVKRVVTRRQMGQDIEMEVLTGDYRPIQGVSEPFSIDIGPKGSSQRMHLAIRKVEPNLPIEDARFRKPD